MNVGLRYLFSCYDPFLLTSINIKYTAFQYWNTQRSGAPEMTEDNTVFIGRKPLMNYVLAVMTQFSTGAEKVTLKARGRAISKAVDVAEIVKNRFLNTASVQDIHIGTEKVEDEERENGINVSWIEILLDKGS
jgi:archaea-specific DNA-binding protein